MKPVPKTDCINCGQKRKCLQIEAHVPLPEVVLQWNNEFHCHEEIHYERGAAVNICRECLKNDFGALAKYLLKEST